MTTPINFNSAYRCICLAYQNAGKLAEGQEPNSEQIATAMNRFNDMINLWMTQGLKLWTNTVIQVTLVGGTALYNGVSLGVTRNLRVLQGFLTDTSGNRTPLTPLSWDEYQRLANITTQGPPNSYFVDKQPTQLNVSFWNTPDALSASTYVANLVVQQQITNVTGILDTLNFAQEWFIALQWGLAAELCTGQPQQVIDRCDAKSTLYRSMLENWDVEDTGTFFTPDQRSQYSIGNFR